MRAKRKCRLPAKKEADAYDKMLDTADLLDTWADKFSSANGRRAT
ncbi:YebG family protein [Escherichia coli]|nr:YebG family protein [Escherichia coli]